MATDRRTAWRVSVALAVGGACATSGQIILLRELLVVFHGNELSLAVVLAAWLLWGSAGSALVGARTDRFRSPVFALLIGLAFASVLLPATVLAGAFAKRALGAFPVETLGLLEFLAVAFILLGPLCFVLGSLFAIGAQILDKLAPARGEVSRAYLLESAGAGGGGLVFSLLVLPHFEPLALAFALGLVLLLASGLLAVDLSSPQRRRAAYACLLSLALVYAAGAVHPLPDVLYRRAQWHGLKLLEARNSLLGSLAAIEIAGQISLYENGLLVATSGYEAHAEEVIHLGMVQHPGPRSVLLIGGGLGGGLREILKYPVERCDYVELDPALLDIGRRHLPAEDLAVLDDPRVAFHHADGRLLVKDATIKYDVILLDLPGPRSAQLNRFYSLEFLQEARQILRRDGVLVFGIASSEVYPAPEQRLLLASLRRTGCLAFPSVALLPGDVCTFVLTSEGDPLTDADDILARLDAAGIERKHVRRGMLSSRLSPWRKAQLEQGLREQEAEAAINTDFRPVGYLYDLAQWSAQFSGPVRHWVGRILSADPDWAYLALLALFLPLIGAKWACKAPASAAEGPDSSKVAQPSPRRARRVLLRPPVRPRAFAVGVAVGVTGISEIVFQVTVLIGFQVLYGYLFYRIGVMVAAFMAGLAIGSFALWRKGVLPPRRAWRWFVGVHVAILFYPLLLPVALRMQLPSVLFMFLPALAGIMGGLEFPLAVRLWQDSGASVARAAGILYALDLFGACAGAAIVAPFLIPLVGLVGICWWTALLNAGTLLLLILPTRLRTSSA